MYGWLRIFLWYNWRYLHINFKLDSDDNSDHGNDPVDFNDYSVSKELDLQLIEKSMKVGKAILDA